MDDEKKLSDSCLIAWRRLYQSKFVMSIVCSYFSEKGQIMVMRKISKQFDRAVLESTRLAMAECRERKTMALKR